MGLKAIAYVEYDGDPRRWELERVDFGPRTLVVGRNATGKTRMLKVIAGFLSLISGKNSTVYVSGTYDVDIQVGDTDFHIEIEMKEHVVLRELVLVNGIERMRRGSDGVGRIYFEKQDTDLDFQVPTNVIALQQRRDEIQHSFIVKLSNWAGATRFVEFAGQENSALRPMSGLNQSISAMGELPIDLPDLIRAYSTAFTRYQHPFDAAILEDMRTLGYDLSDVSAHDMRQFLTISLPEPLIGMSVTEQGGMVVPQHAMSQGMLRALSLVVQMNVALFAQKSAGAAPSLLLVDDIGEGLDYGRSTAVIDMLISRCNQLGTQLIMATNDRFVMNRVALDDWALLRRSGSVVKAHTARNSAKQFEDFKYIGLSNFDFFTSEAFD